MVRGASKPYVTALTGNVPARLASRRGDVISNNQIMAKGDARMNRLRVRSISMTILCATSSGMARMASRWRADNLWQRGGIN